MRSSDGKVTHDALLFEDLLILLDVHQGGDGGGDIGRLFIEGFDFGPVSGFVEDELKAVVMHRVFSNVELIVVGDHFRGREDRIEADSE